MKVKAVDIAIDSIIVEILNVPFEFKSESYPHEIQKEFKNVLLTCDCYGKVNRAVYNGGFTGRGMWDSHFSKKTQKELDKIGKRETKKKLNSFPTKINLKKYGGWY